MPEFLEPVAAAAKARHRQRHTSPGIAVDVEKAGAVGYVLASPYRDHDAWLSMLCDALGTRSESTAKTFAYQLTQLCTQNWHPSDKEGESGEWVPDELQLNMILNIVASVKPKNEMQAMLAAQMVAVHLMTMRATEAAIDSSMMDVRTAAIAAKLARTFAMQTDALAKMQGKRTTRQKITVKYERHDHHHQHVHVEGGGGNSGGQPLDPSDCRNRPGNNGADRTPAITDARGSPLPGANACGVVVPMPSRPGEGAMLSARRGKRLGRSDG